MSSEESGLIQPIDSTTVNQICSGQVVLSLATAVKELLENSIDAGATSIQIKLVEYGSDSVEVIDDGIGVEEVNFQALTLKHHTSKISNFSDLYSVQTFGFRGEALSSLCSLSDVTIITQHKNACVGATLKFDHNGIITSNTKTLRKVGTTVRLENLFNTLPIRRTEFLKNLKREFSKMCSVVYAYGLQSTGIRFSCTNRISKSKLSIKEAQDEKLKGLKNINIMDTKGESVESNIVSIFGVKQKQNLLRITEKLPSQETLDEFGLSNQKLDFEKFKLEGYISSCAHGCGRTSSDRQFYYINSRPVDNSKISRLVNEVYHKFNHHQDPFVVLNIKVAIGSYDMNVTPDKRQILLQNENLLLAVLKESLYTAFQNIPSTMEIQNVGLIKTSMNSNNTTSSEEFKRLKNNFKSLSQIEEKRELLHHRVDSLLKSRLQLSKVENFVTNSTVNEGPLSKFLKKPKESTSYGENIKFKIAQENNTAPSLIESKLQVTVLQNVELKKKDILQPEKKINLSLDQQDNEDVDYKNDMENTTDNQESKRKLCEDNFVTNAEASFKNIDYEELSKKETKRLKLDEGLTEDDKSKRKCLRCKINFLDLKKMVLKGRISENEGQNKLVNAKFFTTILPQNNEKAENELKREITKEKFAQMEIIGQFNLGFIITKINSDIFIIDQHASDEKYNFEILKSTSKIQTQKLFNPEKLILPVDKEELLLENSDIFKKNGFEFFFDNNEPPTKRISLTTVPLIQNVVFGKEDIDELLFYVENAPELKTIRPSRMDKIFASKACRKSVMIGSPLSNHEMRKIVDHMGEIEHPWNCPHGRPTMRHLVNLDMIFSTE